MKTIEQIFEAYNFSATSCHVVVLTIKKKVFTKIESKLPGYIKKLKGIYVSVNCSQNTNVAGIISLNFNGQGFKNFHAPVYKTFYLNDCSHPLTLNEEIRPNSFMQGYFATTGVTEEERPFTLTIYLHYTS